MESRQKKTYVVSSLLLALTLCALTAVMMLRAGKLKGLRKMIPYETAAQLARDLDEAAVALDAAGHQKEAEAKYRQAIAAGYSLALLDYAKFLIREGRIADARRILDRATAALPTQKEVILRLRSEADNPPAPTNPTIRTANAGQSAATATGPDLDSSEIQFKQSTLEMISRNGATGEKHLPETVMGGVAVFDYDSDGWPDIFVTNGGTFPDIHKPDASYSNRLYRNNRDGTFTDVTARAGLAGTMYSIGVAVGDFDNDGYDDIFVAGLNSNTLYRNRGDGTFEDVTAKSGIAAGSGFSVAAGWFDYDNDGLLDLIVVRYVTWDPLNEKICGGDPVRVYCTPNVFQPTTNLLYHNEGNGRFRDVSKESGIEAHKGKGMSVAFGDVDGDGKIDAFVTNDQLPNSLFHNEGSGQFREIADEAGVAYNEDGQPVSSMGTDFRDYDNDGREDIILTDLPPQGFTLYRNLGGGQFSNMTSQSGLARETRPWGGWGIGIFDFNNDGLKDIFAAGGHAMDNENNGLKRRMPNMVFTNKGGGKFTMVTLPGEAFNRGSAFGDFDHNGKIGVVVTRLNEKPLVLRNVSPGTGHWIALRLEGTRSNRDGLGAMVHLISDGGDQWNRATTAVSYASSSERTVHFGVGQQTKVKSIEIEWPSGVRQIVKNPAVDKYLTVHEPR
jgi:tetratricopeptide (TPR) repeat protein